MTASKRAALGSCALAVTAAFAAFTAVWVGWASFTPGDYFGNGSSLLFPSLAIGSLAGAVIGWRTQNKKLKIAIAVLGLCAIGYFAFTPDGWWATPPPDTPSDSAKKRPNQAPEPCR